MKTRLQLLVKATKIGKSVGSGQAPEPEDIAEMRDVLPGVLTSLRERRVIDAVHILVVGEDEPIVPDAWFVPLARCVAFHGTDDEADLSRLAALNQAGQDALIEQDFVLDSDAPVRACYF